MPNAKLYLHADARYAVKRLKPFSINSRLLGRASIQRFDSVVGDSHFQVVVGRAGRLVIPGLQCDRPDDLTNFAPA